MIENIAFGLFVIVVYILIILGAVIISRLERLLNRYRLKYGFDRELEKKEISGKESDYEEKLNRRERRFKRSVFKD